MGHGSHVTAFLPVSEAAGSWSGDSSACTSAGHVTVVGRSLSPVRRHAAHRRYVHSATLHALLLFLVVFLKHFSFRVLMHAAHWRLWRGCAIQMDVVHDGAQQQMRAASCCQPPLPLPTTQPHAAGVTDRQTPFTCQQLYRFTCLLTR